MPPLFHVHLSCGEELLLPSFHGKCYFYHLRVLVLYVKHLQPHRTFARSHQHSSTSLCLPVCQARNAQRCSPWLARSAAGSTGGGAQAAAGQSPRRQAAAQACLPTAGTAQVPPHSRAGSQCACTPVHASWIVRWRERRRRTRTQGLGNLGLRVLLNGTGPGGHMAARPTPFLPPPGKTPGSKDMAWALGGPQSSQEGRGQEEPPR